MIIAVIIFCLIIPMVIIYRTKYLQDLMFILSIYFGILGVALGTLSFFI